MALKCIVFKLDQHLNCHFAVKHGLPMWRLYLRFTQSSLQRIQSVLLARRWAKSLPEDRKIINTIENLNRAKSSLMKRDLIRYNIDTDVDEAFYKIGYWLTKDFMHFLPQKKFKRSFHLVAWRLL
jgi:hypothetical protein